MVREKTGQNSYLKEVLYSLVRNKDIRESQDKCKIITVLSIWRAQCSITYNKYVYTRVCVCVHERVNPAGLGCSQLAHSQERSVFVTEVLQVGSWELSSQNVLTDKGFLQAQGLAACCSSVQREFIESMIHDEHLHPL